MSHDRRKPIRYNTGMLCKEKRAIGMVWVFRWSEEENGQRRQHKEVQSSKQAPIGWHTVRRSLATLLISNGEHNRNVVTPTPKINLELYAEAVSADQQKAHKKVVQMVLLAKFPEKLKARSAAPTS